MRLHAIKNFYDAREGLVTLEDDVLSIVRQVRELYDDRITVELDENFGYYHFVEHCADGADRLIFTTDSLDARALTRLQLADSHARVHTDPYEAAEREQDELQADRDKKYRGYLGEATEMLAHALKREGKEPRLPLSLPVTRRPSADSDG